MLLSFVERFFIAPRCLNQYVKQMRIAARSCHVLSRQPARDNRVVMMLHSSATTKITTMVKSLPAK
jgi:hypothetical protein